MTPPAADASKRTSEAALNQTTNAHHAHRRDAVEGCELSSSLGMGMPPITSNHWRTEGMDLHVYRHPTERGTRGFASNVTQRAHFKLRSISAPHSHGLAPARGGELVLHVGPPPEGNERCQQDCDTHCGHDRGIDCPGTFYSECSDCATFRRWRECCRCH